MPEDLLGNVVEMAGQTVAETGGAVVEETLTRKMSPKKFIFFIAVLAVVLISIFFLFNQ